MKCHSMFLHSIISLLATFSFFASLNAQEVLESNSQKKTTADVRYQQFLSKKESLKENLNQQKETYKAHHLKKIGDIKSQVLLLEDELKEIEQREDDLRASIHRQKALHSLLQLDGEWYNFPVFLFMITLIYLLTRYQLPHLTLQYHRLIGAFLFAITLLYSIGSFANPFPDAEETKNAILKNINLFNRLQGASEVDKLIIKIEQQHGPYVRIDPFETADEDLYVLTYFKKGSFEEDFTLASLYLDAGQKEYALTKLIMSFDKLKKSSKKQSSSINASWRFFLKNSSSRGLIKVIPHLVQHNKELRWLLSSISLINKKFKVEGEELLQLILKKMRSTPDYLAATIYLHALTRIDESQKMYQKALRTARYATDFIKLAEYAYQNHLPERMEEAIIKAFKKSRTTQDWIAYAKFAYQIKHSTFEDGFEKARKSTRKPGEYLNFARYALSLKRPELALEALSLGLKKARKVEDLLLVVDLALQMKQQNSYQEGMLKAVKVARKFEDMFQLSQYAYRQGELAIFRDVAERMIPAARKFTDIKSLFNFFISKNIAQYLSKLVNKTTETRLKPSQYLVLRDLLLNSGHKNFISPIHLRIIKLTRKEHKLLSLSSDFKAKGFIEDASLPLIKIVGKTYSKRKINRIMSQAIKEGLYSGAQSAALRLIALGEGNRKVPDPDLLPKSRLKPNGSQITLITLYAILSQKVGDFMMARSALESEISRFLEQYITEQNGQLRGDINTYFYLHQLWNQIGEHDLLSQFDASYSMMEASYLEQIDERNKATLLAYKKSLDLELNEEELLIERVKHKIERASESLKVLQKRSQDDQIKSLALISRGMVYLIIITLTLFASAFIAWIYQLSLSHFHILGFTIKFVEIASLIICTNVRFISLALPVLITSQLILMLLHTQQEGERGTIQDRFSENLQSNLIWKKLNKNLPQ